MRSVEIDQIAAALATARVEMKAAKYNQINPHFGKQYADLSSVHEATTAALSKHGLAVAQTARMTERGMLMVTTLMHKSGQWIESEWPLPSLFDQPQKLASAVTYARRYSLSSILSIASEADDDANVASEPVAETRAPSPPVQAMQQPAPVSTKEPAWGEEEVAAFITAAYDTFLPLATTEREVKAWWTQNKKNAERLKAFDATRYEEVLAKVQARAAELAKGPTNV